MSIFSKIGHAVKKIFKGIVKVVKKVFESKLFKIVLIAAAIYFGGVALGAWGTAPTAAGAAGEAAVAANGTTAIAGGTGEAALAGGASGDALAANAGAAAGNAAGASSAAEAATAAKTAATAADAAGSSAFVNQAAEVAPSLGAKIAAGASKAAGAIGSYASAHPEVAAMVAGGLAGMGKRDEVDAEREAARLRRQNHDVYGIDLGITPVPYGQQGIVASRTPANFNAGGSQQQAPDYASLIANQLRLTQQNVAPQRVVA